MNNNKSVQRAINKAKCWCFTINNPTERIDYKMWEDAGVRYLSYQEEVGGENKTTHYQGYLELKDSHNLGWLKKNLLPTAHLEIARDPDSADEYTRKEDTRVAGPWVHGSRVRKGQRSDLQTLKESILNGESIQTLADTHFVQMVRYGKMIQNVRNILLFKERTTYPECIVFHGPTGTWKSFYANMMKGKSAYYKDPNNKWWDGYEQQETVIVEEFKGQMPWDTVLRLMDRWPLSVEVKGGTVPFCSQRVIFTSNFCIESWYEGKIDKDLHPLIKRITHYYSYQELTNTFIDLRNTYVIPSIQNEKPKIEGWSPTPETLERAATEIYEIEKEPIQIE